MSTGSQIKINTRERLVSDDHNRSQALQGQLVAELCRFMFDAQNDDVHGGGFESMGTGSETPLRGVILNGVRPRPEVGTNNLFIEPGVALLIDNSAPGPDDSLAAVIVDPGQPTAGILTLTPGGGSTRIDVIECQRVEAVLEQDNRDVFNPSTGLFNAVMVTKKTAARLAYRIRTGTPGGGFPGVAAGWLPLAVCSVPSAATTWDQVTLWDVRPLASDRANAPFDSPAVLPRYGGESRAFVDATTSPGHPRAYGRIDAQFGGYKAGGVFTSDAGGYLDLADSQLPAPGYVLPSFGLWHLWVAFPFNLPRWVRYSGATTGQRVPAGMRGIPILSGAAARWDGTPISTGPALPTWTGLGGTTANAVLLLSGFTDNTPKILPIKFEGVMVEPCDPAHDFGSLFTGPIPIAASAIASDNSTIDFTNKFVDGTTHPANAKAIEVVFGVQMNVGLYWANVGAAIAFQLAFDFIVSGPDGDIAKAAVVFGPRDVQYVTETSNAFPNPIYFQRRVRIPLAPNAQNPTTPRTFSVQWRTAASTIGGHPTYITLTPAEAEVVGWEIGP